MRDVPASDSLDLLRAAIAYIASAAELHLLEQYFCAGLMQYRSVWPQDDRIPDDRREQCPVNRLKIAVRYIAEVLTRLNIDTRDILQGERDAAETLGAAPAQDAAD
jgi:hypothetical protein